MARHAITVTVGIFLALAEAGSECPFAYCGAEPTLQARHACAMRAVWKRSAAEASAPQATHVAFDAGRAASKCVPMRLHLLTSIIRAVLSYCHGDDDMHAQWAIC
jgi:hypothetical protein